MHLCCVNGGNPAIYQPPPGVQGGISEQEQGFRDGTQRDPNTGALVMPVQQGTPDNFRAPFIPTIAMGVPRALRSPNAQVNLNRVFDGAVGWQDTHLLFKPGASMPQGQMQGLPVVSRNTWRARPQPWDTNLYVGVTPTPEG